MQSVKFQFLTFGYIFKFLICINTHFSFINPVAGISITSSASCANWWTNSGLFWTRQLSSWTWLYCFIYCYGNLFFSRGYICFQNNQNTVMRFWYKRIVIIFKCKLSTRLIFLNSCLYVFLKKSRHQYWWYSKKFFVDFDCQRKVNTVIVSRVYKASNCVTAFG